MLGCPAARRRRGTSLSVQGIFLTPQCSLEILQLFPSCTDTLQGLNLILPRCITHPGDGSSQAACDKVINVLQGKAVFDKASHSLISAETL